MLLLAVYLCHRRYTLLLVSQNTVDAIHLSTNCFCFQNNNNTTEDSTKDTSDDKSKGEDDNDDEDDEEEEEEKEKENSAPDTKVRDIRGCPVFRECPGVSGGR